MKCQQCSRDLFGSEFKSLGSKKYCLVCYPEVVVNEEQRVALIAFIIDRYKIDKPTGFMFGQMKKMREKYSYKNMRLTLMYAFDVLGLKPNEKYGLTLINYYHDDMVEYYKRLVAKSNKNKKIDYQEKQVTITSVKKEDYRKEKMFDLNKFEEE